MIGGFGLSCDSPSPRDFKAKDILSSVPIVTPSKVDLSDGQVLDQGLDGTCSAYSITAAKAILDNIEHNTFNKFDPEEQWNNQMINSGRPLTDRWGDSLQNALDTLKKYGLTLNGKNYPIEGYAQIENVLQVWKDNLTLKHPIYTGIVVTETNMGYVDVYGVLGLEDKPQTFLHAIAIVGFDDGFDTLAATTMPGTIGGGHDWGIGAFKCQNSWGSENRKYGGYFYLPYQLFTVNIDWLLTPYILFDKKDLPPMPTSPFVDVNENSPHWDAIKWAFDNGLIKGYPEDHTFRPDMPLTRRELVIILKRFNDLIKPV